MVYLRLTLNRTIYALYVFMIVLSIQVVFMVASIVYSIVSVLG